MDQQNNQSNKIEDLAVRNAESVVGGTKMPSPTTPISSPKPTQK